MTPLQVTVFTDFACPYSYLSEAVLWDLREAEITLRFRAFELYPDAAESPTTPWTPAERVANERLAY